MNSIQEIEKEITEEFEFFDDWTDKYEYIIELGQKLPPFPEDKKTDAYKIKGCQSSVWIISKEENGHILLQGDSDSSIVKGLIALLIQVLSNQAPDAILQAKLEFIDQIGLSQHLAQTRANGLSAMVKQIKLDALALKNKTAN
jgi:cysteine desulfuration protein SufE